MSQIIYSAVLLLAITIAVLNEIWQRKTKIPPAPTMPWVKRAMISMLTKHIDTSKPLKIADLGSGWGGLSYAIAKAFPKADIYGCELSPAPYIFSKIRQLFSRKAVQFERRDLLTLNLQEYDIIVCYLCPPMMRQLKQKLEHELKAGTYVICNAFPVPDWNPIDETKTGKLPPIPVFLYKA